MYETDGQTDGVERFMQTTWEDRVTMKYSYRLYNDLNMAIDFYSSQSARNS